MRWALPALPLGFVLLVLAAPVARLLGEGLTGAEVAWWAVWQDEFLRQRIAWTFAQAAITCALSLVLGLPLAWVLARWEFAGRRWVLRGLMLPFVVPTLVAALGVLALWRHRPRRHALAAALRQSVLQPVPGGARRRGGAGAGER